MKGGKEGDDGRSSRSSMSRRMLSRRRIKGWPQIGKSESDSRSFLALVANGSPRLNWVLTASRTCEEELSSIRERTEIVSCCILTVGRIVPVNSDSSVVLVLLCDRVAFRKTWFI